MKLLQSFALFPMCMFVLLAHALPLSELRNEPFVERRKAPYSVVPVDGGQPDGAAPPKTEIVTKDSTQTVTEPPKTLPPVTETILSTSIITDSETPTTIITTITTTSTPITIQAPAPEVSPSTSLTPTTVISLVSTTNTIIVTTTPAPPTLTPYDNGMWHTTYYKAPGSASSSDTSIAAASETSSISSVESAAFTGSPPNGTYILTLRGIEKPNTSNTLTTRITTRRSIIAAVKTRPPMPTLPTTSEVVSPTEVPSIDLSKHMVPGFGR